MLFNWLDRNLEKPPSRSSRLSQGKIFMVHSGAFYDVEKKLLEPGELPETLHWFKWQNFTTWLTGISLLVIVYYMQRRRVARRSDGARRRPTSRSRSRSLAVHRLADLRRPLAHARRANPRARDRAVDRDAVRCRSPASRSCSTARAAYIQTGVIIGTMMTGNVWLRHRAVAARADRGDEAGQASRIRRCRSRAKQRSIHNNYLTFPLLFIMLSNHFPAATGHPSTGWS